MKPITQENTIGYQIILNMLTKLFLSIFGAYLVYILVRAAINTTDNVARGMFLGSGGIVGFIIGRVYWHYFPNSGKSVAE
jgi:uncharacterized membrane protein